MSATFALEASPPDELQVEDSDVELVLDEAERSLIETIGLFGDEGWEAVAANYPITWRTWHSVPSARATFQKLCAKRLVRAEGGRILLTEEGKWIAGMLR